MCNRKLLVDYNFKSPIARVYDELRVEDIIDTIISHNNIIELYEESKDDPHYSVRIWKGMAHRLPKHFGRYKFLSINGSICENIADSDHINIQCCKISDYK